MKRTIAISAAGLALALTLPALAGDDVRLEDLPGPVRQTVQREVKDGHIDDIERDEKAGEVFYEIEFTLENQDWEIAVAPDGKLLHRKKD